jgi:transcriptional regulator with XRE-family HTH domain
VENEGIRPEEDFAQILKRLKSEYDVTDSEVARRIGVSVSTVNTWVHRKRTPRDDAIKALAEAFPSFSERDLFLAAGRKAPGRLAPDAEQRILDLIRGLTAEQQEMTEAQLRAWTELNRA